MYYLAHGSGGWSWNSYKLAWVAIITLFTTLLSWVDCIYERCTWKWCYPDVTGKTRTNRTPAFWGYPPPPHDYPPILFIDIGSQVKTWQSQSYKFKEFAKTSNFLILKKKIYTWHTFWSCLIRSINMKWIWLVLWKIQSRHYSVHRRTDAPTDGWAARQTRWNQYTPLQLVERRV